MSILVPPFRFDPLRIDDLPQQIVQQHGDLLEGWPVPSVLVHQVEVHPRRVQAVRPGLFERVPDDPHEADQGDVMEL